MPRLCAAPVSLLAIFTLAHGLALAAEDIKFEPLPPLGQTPSASSGDMLRQPPPLLDQAARLPSAELSPTDKPVNLNGSATETPPALGDFTGYRYASSALECIPGGGDRFGIFSVQLQGYQPSGISNGIITGFDFYVFSGPLESDMPPRAYDFSIGYQLRHRWGPLAFDLAAAVQVASDFNGDAHKGVQIPGHGVGYLTVRPDLDLVFGIDYLDRADIKMLPVAGVLWNPNPDMRFELVFPRPRAVYRLNDTYRIYCYGELGGGSWAINRPGLGDNVATYRDLRVCIGLESVCSHCRSAIEVGYAFDRRLEYTSCVGNMHLDDAVILRAVMSY
jgi:hypothetical protein